MKIEKSNRTGPSCELRCTKRFCLLFFALYFLVVLGGIACVFHAALSETLTVVITSGHLNARAEPEKGAEITMRLEAGDTVEAVSVKDGWIEVAGGETGTSWCKAEYLSSSSDSPHTYVNTSGGRVRVRDEIGGDHAGWVRSGASITVTRTVLGWGYIGSGWVDLSFFE